VVDSGYKAIELAKRNFYSVILCDINMPGINGVETLKRIKKVSPASTVIMMTAGASRKMIDDTIKEGAYDVVKKPFEVKKLLDTIFEALKAPLVIVINDENTDTKLLQSQLKEHKYEVIMYKNEDSIDLIGENKVDVMLLDMHMPEFDGSKIIEDIKESYPDTCIIMFTGKYSEDVARKAIQYDSINCLSKPMDINDIIKNVEIARNKIAEDNSKNIILVEDDRNQNMTLTKILKNEGYLVESVYNGKDAVEKVKKGIYSIAIVDYKLPDITGIEVVRKIREVSDTEVVFLSGHASLEVAIEAIREEVNDFFTKPVDVEKLLDRLKKIITRKQ